ncbi:TonB-dependent receptor [Catenovulum maritimum]|uniref:TonB-dependent receptor n=1 Tax=Catenovulum maritimum TaxID=1513271 RepID=A0A0J8GLJ8_9ALTE|nr:TonB-dependent receptor [Catenovulum maritimum]KMT63680.1 TonB-dependent receptor [Catenovulum maritimum]
MNNNKFKLLPVSFAISCVLTTIPSISIAADEEETEIIQVSGIRSSLAHSMELKKNAPSIQDSIVAEDIGKFPDQNVAESLQRISGVMISRTNGEGAQVSVRGMGPKFNAVKVNNRTVATTERGREFDFQSIPSELISGADVIKASRANIAEGSLGAYVNVNTARPLSKPGFHAVGSIHALYNDLAGETGTKLSGIVSNTFADGTLGVVVGVSKQTSTNRIDAAGTTHWASFDADGSSVIGDVRNTAGAVVPTGSIYYPGRATYTLDQEDRERTSLNTTLQWSPTEDFVNTVDFLYSELSRQARSSGIQVPMQGAGWEDLVVTDNNTVLTGIRRSRPIDTLLQERGQDSETFAFGYNGKLYLNELTLTADVAYSKAESTPRGNTLVAHATNPNYDNTLDINHPDYIDGQIKGVTENDYINFDNSGDIMTLDTSIEFGNPAAIRSHWNDIQHKELEDTVFEAKFDANYELDSGVFRSVDMGLAYTDREKSQDTYQIANGCLNRDKWVAPTGDTDEEIYTNRNTIFPYNTCGQRHDFEDSLFSFNKEAFLEDEAGNFPRTFVLVNDFDAYKQAVADIRDEDDWTTEIHKPASSVANTEKVTALYTQLNLEGDSSSFNWTGNFGVRYVKTETSSTGHRKFLDKDNITESPDTGEGIILGLEYTPEEAVTAVKEYSHVLPSFNLNLDFNNGFFIKTAAAKVITRPALEDTGVNSTYPANIRVNQYNTKGGNPDLDPYEATQYDLSFEYYSDGGDSYSVGLFHKAIDTFISQKTVLKDTGYIIQSDPDYGSFYEIRQEQTNRTGGSVTGIELAALHNFDYLPGLLSGFGVQANFTYTDTKDDEAASDEIKRDSVKSGGSGLEGFSKTAYNLIGFYDKDNFQARLAYNWRDDYLKHRSGPVIGSNGLPQHVEAYGQFDFSASYDLSENMTISAEAINLTNENILEYADIRERVTLLQYSGRRFQVGFTTKF